MKDPVLGPRARRTPSSRSRRPLTCEPLEARDVPAGFFHALGDAGPNSAWGVVADADGNSYVGGSFRGTVDFDPGAAAVPLTSAGESDGYVAKYLADGTLAWAQRVGGPGADYTRSVTADGSGNLWAVGYFEGTIEVGPYALTADGTDQELFIARLDAGTGAVLQALHLCGPSDPAAAYTVALRAASSDAAGNLYLTGFFRGTIDFDPDPGVRYNLTPGKGASYSDGFVVQVRPDGTFGWVQQMGGVSWQTSGGAVTTAPNGAVYVVGKALAGGTFGSETFSNGSSSIFVSRLDTAGQFLWTKMFTRSAGVVIGEYYGIAADAAGNVYVTGNAQHGTDFDPGAGLARGTGGVFAASLDAAGTYRWARHFGAAHSASGSLADGRDMSIGPDGNLYFAGGHIDADFDAGPGAAVMTGAGGLDAYLTRLDTSGNFLGQWRLGGADDDRAIGLALHQAPGCPVEAVVAGSFAGTATADVGPGYGAQTSAGNTDGFLWRVGAGPGVIMGRVTRKFSAQDLVPLSGRTVYLDHNGNGQPDAGEPSTVTGAAGQYEFRHLQDGTYTVRTVAPAGWTQASPAGGAGQVVTVAAGQFATGRDFALTAPSQAVTFAVTKAVTIPKSASVTSTLKVTDTRAIRDLSVKVNISHGRLTDIDILLHAPDGTQVYLTAAGDLVGVNATNTVFNGEAALDIVQGTAPYTGEYRAAEPLSQLYGKSLKGDWRLEIFSKSSGLGGKLNSWSLTASVDATALTAGGGSANGNAVSPLTDVLLQPIVREAVRRWNQSGLTAAERRLLKTVQFNIADLDGATLGLAAGNTVTLDYDAAGYGWFVDPTPRSDSEFRRPGDQGEKGKMDLLTTVIHELGHVLGRDHEAVGVMSETLSTGARERIVPGVGAELPEKKAGKVSLPAWFLSSGRSKR